MKNVKFSTISLAISLLVFLAATLTFMISYFGFPETHPLAPLISSVIFIIYLTEIPLIYVSRFLGFPIVLPILVVIFTFISFRRKEDKKALSIVSIVLVLASISMYLSLQSLTYQGGENKEESVFCTQDAKLCPDGSYVSRTGKNCQFAQCPSAVSAPATVTFGDLTILAIGEQIKFSDGLTVTLMEINDSRCYEEVVCVWAGELSFLLRITGGNVGNSFKEIRLGTATAVAGATENDYAFTLQGATETTATIMVIKNSGNTQKSNATNFEECAKAGYPVLQSYPRQCRTPDGKNFVENL